MDNPTKTIKEKFYDCLAEIGSVQRDATNPFARAKYASLSNVQKSVMPALHKNRLLIHIEFDKLEAGVYHVPVVITDLDSDNTLNWEFAVPLDTTQKNPVQGFGATTTYAQRYALCVVFQIALDDEDPDAGKAQPQAARPQQAAPAALKLIPLNIGDANYAKCVAYLATTQGAKISDLKTRYTLTEAVIEQIQIDTLNYTN